MLTHPTYQKLQSLRFFGMANAFSEQLQMPEINELSFEERLGLLVDREVNKAIVEADIVIFMCEKEGLAAVDYQLGEDIRRRNKKVIFDRINQTSLKIIRLR